MPRIHMTHAPLTATLLCAAMLLAPRFCPAAEADPQKIHDAVTFYASFDEQFRGDFGGGGLAPQTRYDHATKKNTYEFKPGYPANAFRIAKGQGLRGGALEGVDVLPRRGRVFFPAQGNLAYKPTGWGGAASFWLNTDPNKLLKTPFCDPLQITENGASNGGLWIDFPNAKPRDLRLGAFRAVKAGEKAVAESDPAAPLVILKNVGFKAGDWHHVVLTWNHLDTGRKNAEAQLYIDGKRIGGLSDREIAMNWNLAKTGIYVAVSYIGLMDEFALFDRQLTAGEVRYLHENPGFEFPRGKKAVSQQSDYSFEPDTQFVKLPEGLKLGSCSAVSVNSRGEMFLFHRGRRPIIVLDAEGNYLRSWGDSEISVAHGLRIDRDDNVWVTDIGAHRVFKYDRLGKLLLALGTGKPGDGPEEFNKPTDIAFGPRGEVYISDGYGNSRVKKYTPGGRLIKMWGEPGKGRGQFNLPHSAIVDSQGRLLVGDRENNRIQVFDT